MRASIGLGMGLALLSVCTVAQTRPVVYEEKVKLTAPDRDYDFFGRIAIDGNDLLAMAINSEEETHKQPFGLFHFERQSDGSWVSRGQVDGLDYSGVGYGYYDVALRGGLAVWTAEESGIHILERTATGWTVTDLESVTTLPGLEGSEVRVVGNTIAIGAREGAQCKIDLVRKNAQGVWSLAETIVSDDDGCSWGDGDELGPDMIEYTGTQALISHNLANIYDRINNAWVRTPLERLSELPVVIGNEIARRAGSARAKGDILYLDRRNGTGQWAVRDTLRSEESYVDIAPANVIVRGNRAIAGAPKSNERGWTPIDQSAGAINVLDRDASGRFAHVATLVTRENAAHLGGGVRSSLVANDTGRTIAAYARDARNDGAVYVYELPATLPQPFRVQDNFEDVNAAGWTPNGLTNWTVVQSDGSYVYRQANAQGDARAILDSPTSQNQSIEATVKLNTFGPTSWAGLVTRYIDSANFYYLMIWKSTNTIQIRKMVNGQYSTVAEQGFAPQAGQTYRLRLEAVGSRLRAYVDDQWILEATDSSLKSGKAGLTMWKTAADYDNVIVSSSPATELFSDAFGRGSDDPLTPWEKSAGSVWSYVNNSIDYYYQQSVLDITARAINGSPARDQIVSADIRPLTFHASGTPFAGLIARYVDSANYYYVLLNKNNTVSLRKLSNGSVVTLDEAPLTIQPNTTYAVRLEAIGTSLRLYVNGKLMAEAEDSSYASGRYGLVTYRSTAQFDNFNAVRP